MRGKKKGMGRWRRKQLGEGGMYEKTSFQRQKEAIGEAIGEGKENRGHKRTLDGG